MLLLQVWLTTLAVIALIVGAVAAVVGPPLYRRWKVEQRAEQIRREQAAEMRRLRGEAEQEVRECLQGEDGEVRCPEPESSEKKVQVNRWT